MTTDTAARKTPLTDAFIDIWRPRIPDAMAAIDFARSLEAQLAEANRLVAFWQKSSEEWKASRERHREDADHVRQANINYREENRLAIDRAERAEQEAAQMREDNAVLDRTLKAFEDVGEKLSAATRELNSIDAALGNRSAFDGCKTRTEKVLLAIKVAGQLDPSGKVAAAIQSAAAERSEG